MILIVRSLTDVFYSNNKIVKPLTGMFWSWKHLPACFGRKKFLPACFGLKKILLAWCRGEAQVWWQRCLAWRDPRRRSLAGPENDCDDDDDEDYDDDYEEEGDDDMSKEEG